MSAKIKNYIIEQSAIGDLLIFISFLCDNYSSDTIINIDIDKKSLEYWRSDSNNYYEFSKKFINFICPNNISFIENLSGSLISVEHIKNLYLFNDKEFPLLDLKNKFNNTVDDSKIVLTTKIRYLNRSFFDSIKNDFFKIINSSNKSIILVGEKILEYGKEYSIHGDQTIYSIYPDIINGINPEKIIDKTIPASGITTPDFDNLKNDLDLISKYRTLGFGISGINFLYSSVTDFKGYCEDHNFLPFIDRNRKIFKTKNDFLTITNEYLK